MSKQLPYYYRNLNRSLLDFLPQGLGRVLEFGCSAGMLGKNYKKNNPDTVWHGVEINVDAAEYAKHNLDHVLVDNGNEFNPDDILLEKPYDAIIYGDVIEHFVAPEESLPQHLPLLKTGGELIACIPNLQHWSVMSELLQGRFEYTENGLLDKTHLRFFTRSSIKNMMKRLDLKINRFSYIQIDDTLFPEKIEHRNKLLELLELTAAAGSMDFNKQEFMAFQYLVRAQKNN